MEVPSVAGVHSVVAKDLLFPSHKGQAKLSMNDIKSKA